MSGRYLQFCGLLPFCCKMGPMAFYSKWGPKLGIQACKIEPHHFRAKYTQINRKKNNFGNRTGFHLE